MMRARHALTASPLGPIEKPPAGGDPIGLALRYGTPTRRFGNSCTSLLVTASRAIGLRCRARVEAEPAGDPVCLRRMRRDGLDDARPHCNRQRVALPSMIRRCAPGTVSGRSMPQRETPVGQHRRGSRAWLCAPRPAPPCGLPRRQDGRHLPCHARWVQAAGEGLRSAFQVARLVQREAGATQHLPGLYVALVVARLVGGVGVSSSCSASARGGRQRWVAAAVGKSRSRLRRRCGYSMASV